MDWIVSEELVDYEQAVDFMEQRVAGVRGSEADECVWLLQHPSLYTAGTSADEKDLIDARFPVYSTGRGGQYTYHGPGQRVGYVMLNLRQRHDEPDIRKYVWSLEEWVIRTLARFDVTGERREGRVGIWVDMQPYGGVKGQESKIAALGVRVRHWVSYHGVSINVDPDLTHFSGIVPCGIMEHGVTSLAALGKDVSMVALDEALRDSWGEVFKR